MGFGERDIYLFKVKGYNTILAGEMVINQDGERTFFTVKDGETKHEYHSDKIEWFKFVKNKNTKGA